MYVYCAYPQSINKLINKSWLLANCNFLQNERHVLALCYRDQSSCLESLRTFARTGALLHMSLFFSIVLKCQSLGQHRTWIAHPFFFPL